MSIKGVLATVITTELINALEADKITYGEPYEFSSLTGKGKFKGETAKYLRQIIEDVYAKIDKNQKQV